MERRRGWILVRLGRRDATLIGWMLGGYRDEAVIRIETQDRNLPVALSTIFKMADDRASLIRVSDLTSIGMVVRTVLIVS